MRNFMKQKSNPNVKILNFIPSVIQNSNKMNGLEYGTSMIFL